MRRAIRWPSLRRIVFLLTLVSAWLARSGHSVFAAPASTTSPLAIESITPPSAAPAPVGVAIRTTDAAPSPLLAYVKKATWEETCVASLAASSVSAPVLGNWFYVGPFDNSDGNGFDTVYPPEKQIALDEAYEGKGSRLVRWKRGDRFVDGRVNDLLPLFDQKANAVVYLYRTIYCLANMERVVSLGSDDTLTVWLNGVKVLAKNVARAAAPDQDRATLKLREGRNDLLLKVCQGGGSWAFYFSMDCKVPPSVEVPLLRQLIADFPADPNVDTAYQRVYEVRHTSPGEAETPTLDLFGINVKEFGASGEGRATNGNIDAGARIVTNVADTETFRPGQGIYLWHFKPLDGVAAVEAARSDYVASVRLRPEPGDGPSEAGLAFRVADAKSYWALSAAFAGASARTARVRLVQVRDGSPTELRAKDVDRPTSPLAAISLKVVLAGERIQALVNDRALFDLNDRFNGDARKVGLYHNASHHSGSPLVLEFRVDSEIEDRFDRLTNRYDLGAAHSGQPWQAVAGRWGIVDGTARRTEGAVGEKLSTVVAAVRGREIEMAHPWPGEDNSLVEIYHDDTAAIERALGIRAGGDIGLGRHLIFPEGGYNISRTLRLGPLVKLTGLNPSGGTGAWIGALPGLAPEYDAEEFLLYWVYGNGSDGAGNRQQSLENIRLGVFHPESNPGLSGVRLATGPGSRYVNIEVNVPRRGIVVAAGSADSLFETIGVIAGETCIDLLGQGTRSLTFRNVNLRLYDIGKTAVGLRIRSGTAGVVAQGLSCRGPARPVLIQGGEDITLLGLNVAGHSDYPVVEVERAPDDLSFMIAGVAQGAAKAVTIGGETVAWVHRPGDPTGGPRAFRFIGGQSSFWMGKANGGGQVNYFDNVHSAQEIRGGESIVVDLIDTRTRGGGSIVYDYVVSTGQAGGTVEVGSLTLLHNFQDFQVVRTVKGRVGPEAAQSLFTPDAEMRDGLLSLRIGADVPRERSIWFNAVKTGLGLPGPGFAESRASSPPAELAAAPSKPGADGFIRDWLVIGPVPYKGDTTRGVLSRDDLGREGRIRPLPGQVRAIRGESLRWTVAHSEEPALDLNRAFSPNEWRNAEAAFGYAVAYLEAERDIANLTLELDCDESARVWLSDREVKLEGAAPPFGEKLLAYHGAASGVTLRKGENVLVLKVCNESGRWAVAVRFKDADGRPVYDFRVATVSQEMNR